MEKLNSIITVNSEIQNGQPVFANTRVPVESLFMHLEKGISLDVFLEDFPSVKKEQAIYVLELAEKIFNSKNLNSLLDEIAA